MSNKKNNLKGKIIVISVSIVTLILLIAFITNSFSSKNKSENTERVVVSQTGEASNINFKVPTKKEIEVDSLSLIEKFDAYKRDSISNSKKENINLRDASTLFNKDDNKKNNQNMRLSNNNNNNNAVQDITEGQNSNETNIMASKVKSNESSYRSSNSNRSRTRSAKVVEVKNNVNINDFFTKKPKTETNSNNSKSINTDTFIHAVIHKDQKIKDNGRITFRLTKPAIINGNIYKANTYVFGFAQFGTNRINVEITNIDNTPVNLYAYDKQDGNIGLYVEGANAVGDLGKHATEDMVRDVDVSGIPLGNTVKSLFRKKNKEVSVFLLNNYEVILKTTK